MANEAVIIELLGGSVPNAQGIQEVVAGNPVRFTVADGAGIEKGTLMQLSSDPRTITASSGDNQIFVGVLAEEKVISDGVTNVSVWTKGIFDMTNANVGAITLGNYAKLNGANLIDTADEAGAQGATEHVGMVLESAAKQEVVAVWINRP